MTSVVPEGRPSRVPSRAPLWRRIVSAVSRRDAVYELRRRGVRGGVIRQHRAMATLSATPMLLVNMLAIPLALTVGVLLALPWITDRWGDLLRALGTPLGFGNVVLARAVSIGNLYSLAIPYVNVQAPWPGRVALVVGAVGSLLALAATFALSPRQLPLRYAIRAVVALQLVSIAYFALARPPFAYRLPDYLVGFLSTGAAVLVLLPLLLGLTFFLFHMALWRKLLLAALLVAHMAVLFPLQALVHAYLVTHATLLVLPPLFLVFGLLVETAVFVAFYGWGMSWAGHTAAEDAVSPPRRRRSGARHP
ncbi:hypothetical protein [Gemmatirosa kalamazoonensis]|uniref:hypothetical protein n=1 Tax=Gemmatirosa kalamazoonensis TaxID=861299 RepID=UPI0011DD05BF|nr:hypothetical protein [Gemmatirosa kalamazoonensis]